MTEIKIETDFIKLDALLKFANLVSSGGEAKIRIAEGEVQVNGEIARCEAKAAPGRYGNAGIGNRQDYLNPAR